CSRSTSRSLTNVPLVDPRSIRKYCPSSHQIFACLEETPASAMRMLHAEARPTVIASGVSSISWLSRDPLRIRSNAIWTADVSQGARLASKGQGANLDPRPRRTLRFTPFPTRVSSMPEAAASSDVGTSFGKFFLLKKLAAGGMGEVFLARQQGPAGFQKVLVVKKILAHLTESKEFVEAFLGEARLAAQMNHRNIVQVFELGEQDGAYFIAMEYVQGKSLRDLIDASVRRKERIPAELCRTLAEQICDGASYAHNLTDLAGRSLNLVHRDLNPQNVLISYGGDVKIIDFGIAKSELSTVKTEAGMIKGKFVYMSPEQSLAKRLDKRSDVFAIGISLYEMLTGINPFHKDNIVLTLEAVQRHDPAPPSEYDPSYAPFD